MTEENLIEIIADLKVENFKLQQRIDKVIEYIYKNVEETDGLCDAFIIWQIEEILKGSDNNEWRRKRFNKFKNSN